MDILIAPAAYIHGRKTKEICAMYCRLKRQSHNFVDGCILEISIPDCQTSGSRTIN